jgi:hypothetical protein
MSDHNALKFEEALGFFRQDRFVRNQNTDEKLHRDKAWRASYE